LAAHGPDKKQAERNECRALTPPDQNLLAARNELLRQQMSVQPTMVRQHGQQDQDQSRAEAYPFCDARCERFFLFPPL